jgi:uncharacterized membrane-anchored protein
VSTKPPPSNAAGALLRVRMALHSGDIAAARALAEAARRHFPDDAPLRRAIWR